ncbi:hypothetical protein [Agarivorans sp. Alg241-V36]|uniref:hypothetical protein n=1 Tax=Agarivorans sp. Alg241-V36 TaxID=2305992 RepID=UPI0013D796DE|nr:hypothetical protein [Agarivorans sp. Alg241-V36]
MKAWIISILCLFSFSSLASIEVSIIGDQGTISNYQQLLELKGNNLGTIDDYHSPYSDRATVSLLLLVQAISFSDLNFTIEFKASPNTGRSLREVKQGDVAVYQADIWESDFDDSTYKSVAIIAPNTFEKGFYVSSNSPLLTQPLSLEQLKELPISVGKTWHQDIAQLEQSGFTNINTLNRNQSLLGMLSKERIQIAFLEFPNNPDLAIHDSYGSFYPIPNYKIKFQQSRHFMVSKKHPYGAEIAQAIDQGLTKMARLGLIEKAMRQSGVKQERVKHWQAPEVQTPEQN